MALGPRFYSFAKWNKAEEAIKTAMSYMESLRDEDWEDSDGCVFNPGEREDAASLYDDLKAAHDDFSHRFEDAKEGTAPRRASE